MTFELKALIKEVLAETDSTDAVEVAGMVRRRIPVDQESAIFVQLLVAAVRDGIRSVRKPFLDHGAPKNGTTRSAKWENVRKSVGSIAKTWRVEGAKGYVFLGACDTDGLTFLVIAYRERAHKNTAWAERYAALRDAMVEFNAATVADVPDEIVDKIMMEDAAIEEPTSKAQSPHTNGQGRARQGAIPTVDAPVPADPKLKIAVAAELEKAGW